jgi:hypothetical protein
MKLSNLIVDTKSAWIEYPACPGFEVELVCHSTTALAALRKKSTTEKWSKREVRMVEVVNEEKFVSDFTRAVIKNWKGLKIKDVATLLLVNVGPEVDGDTEVEYSPEDAELLIKRSREFDSWVNEMVFDLANFR